MKIRLTGSQKECSDCIYVMEKMGRVQYVSDFYPNTRGYHRHPEGRVYCEVDISVEKKEEGEKDERTRYF